MHSRKIWMTPAAMLAVVALALRAGAAADETTGPPSEEHADGDGTQTNEPGTETESFEEVSALRPVNFSGFGGWGYGRTDGNNYALGTEQGDYQNFDFALNVSANPHEKLIVNAQAFWINSAEGLEVRETRRGGGVG